MTTAAVPPPVPPPNLFESERSDVTVVPQAPVPPPPMTVKPDVKLLPAAVNGDEDYLMLGSDAEDNWDDFDLFIINLQMCKALRIPLLYLTSCLPLCVFN